MELAGWPEVYLFMAREYHYTPEQVNQLTLIQMCALLGAITPDHQIQRLPMRDYMRLAGTAENREVLRRVHGR